MKIAVCDDNKASREHIVSLINLLINERMINAEIKVFENGEDMLNSQESFDISFLDVEMKEVSGLDVARHIRQNQEKYDSFKSIIIFVTGYEKYVYDAFDVSAFQYLLKPVDEEKFANIFMRALQEAYTAEKRTKQYIIVKNLRLQQKVYLKDIYYIESANKKVIIHTDTGVLESYGKMEEMQEAVGTGFYRCHRCYLVNMEKIISYNANTIQVVNGEKLILARKKYTDFVRQYIRYARDGGIVNV